MSPHHLLTPQDFLKKPDAWLVLDVRSPGEFAQGHIPNAVNVPLLRDDERAAVGTAYKQQGRQQAVLLGWELVGPRMREIAETLLQYADRGSLLLYCARGGMRSAIMTNFVDQLDLPASRLAGGYKAFRAELRERFAEQRPVVILGGMTGTGKTEVLQLLAEAGEAVVDLEQLANHKGSAFGALGQAPQPTQQMFENLVGMRWATLPPEKPVWLENESRRIGTLRVPEALWEQMCQAPVVEIVVPMPQRLERLLREYGVFGLDALRTGIERIRNRLGGLQTQRAVAALEQGQTSDCFEILLQHYYDKCYQNGLKRRNVAASIPVEEGDLDTTVKRLQAAVRELYG